MVRAARWASLLLFGTAGCSAPAVEPQQGDPESIKRGKAAAIRLGCAACHDLPDISWPKGRVGPALHGFGDQAMIAGALPNNPDALSAFLLNPAAQVPQSAMPAIPMTRQDARDMADWLHSLRSSSGQGIGE